MAIVGNFVRAARRAANAAPSTTLASSRPAPTPPTASGHPPSLASSQSRTPREPTDRPVRIRASRPQRWRTCYKRCNRSLVPFARRRVFRPRRFRLGRLLRSRADFAAPARDSTHMTVRTTGLTDICRTLILKFGIIFGGRSRFAPPRMIGASATAQMRRRPALRKASAAVRSHEAGLNEAGGLPHLSLAIRMRQGSRWGTPIRSSES